MKLLFVSSEVYPFSKTGGLADVAGALPAALVKLGLEPLVITPWYRTLQAEPAPLWIGDVEVPFDGGFTRCGVGTLEREGVRYAFVGHADFQRARIYGYDDDVKRFALFSRAVPQVAARLGFVPDIVHANDWHSGALPMILQQGWHLPNGFPGLPSVYTIHNVQYQGETDLGALLYWLRLPGALRHSYLNHFGRANLMQAGAGFAERVTTVSSSYAEEIQRPEYGYGLDGTFRHLSHKLSGILNGLDISVWNPATDPVLPRTYNSTTLDDKRYAKLELCNHMNLDPQRPLLGVVSRLVEQKGIDLVLEALPGLLAQDWNLLVLGTGEPQLETALQAASHHHSGRVSSYIGYDEALAHLIYAGADALAIPSRFEPCGLSQMIAMRYGTVPVARQTGGLADSIDHGRTGFLFEHATPTGLLWASGVAQDSYHHKGRWHAMMKSAMNEDFSWKRAAEAYRELYQQASSEVARGG